MILFCLQMGGAAPPPTPPLFLKATHACHCASFDIISLFPDFFTIFMLSGSFSSWKARSTANNSIWRSSKATNTASHSPNKTKRIKTALKPFGFLRDANNASRSMSLVLVWIWELPKNHGTPYNLSHDSTTRVKK